MINHNINHMSESEEMYLITVARLVEQGVEEPIPISQLAEERDIQPVSANQMVHKLAEEGLVAYVPYKGVELTAKGRQLAGLVLRYRRLWEVFLVEHLGLSANEADALACRFEHITPEQVINRLDAFLGHPSTNPLGLPIPVTEGEITGEISQLLVDVPIGQRREVVRVKADAATRAFLEAAGIRPGSVVSPLAVGADGAMLVKSGDNRIHLAGEVVENILVGFVEHTDLK